MKQKKDKTVKSAKTALVIFTQTLSKDLDIYHLGYNNKHYKVEAHCLTIGENEPNKATAVPSNFQIDGKFNSNTAIFNYCYSIT